MEVVGNFPAECRYVLETLGGVYANDAVTKEEKMAPGERLRVLATDRAAIADFKAFCQETGHALIAMSEEAGVLSFVIRRRPDPPAAEPPAQDAAPKET